MADAAAAAAKSPAPHSAAEIKTALVELLPNLRAFARSLCPNPARADDLVQDSIVKALANIDRFEPGSNLRAWMFTILRNTFYSDLRKLRREVEDADGEHAARLADRPGQLGAVDLEDFKRAFAQLSSDHREVLTLVGAFGVPYEEAAEICGCAVGTIKSRVNRARARLAELMGVNVDEALGSADEHALPQGVIAASW
jgi:RNA polymerase sigma-70 factor (ECF subfamily)